MATDFNQPMPRRRTSTSMLALVALSWSMLCGASTAKEIGPDELPVNDPNLFKAWLDSGRQSFLAHRYPEALVQYRKALELRPADPYARFAASVAAYWAQDPQAALDGFDALLKGADLGPISRWDLTSQRLLALSALGKTESVEQCVQLLISLRKDLQLQNKPVPEGFTREHMRLKALRAGIWHSFTDDPRAVQYKISLVKEVGMEPGTNVDSNGLPITPQEFPLLALSIGPDRAKPYTLEYVLFDEAPPLEAGGNTIPGPVRVWKRWSELPKYPDVRAVAQEMLEGKLVAEKAAGAPDADTSAKEAAAHADELLKTSERLAKVQFDLSRSVKLSLIDPEKARAAEEKELAGPYPKAQEDAAELIKQVARLSPDEFNIFFSKLPETLDRAKGGYLAFTLLTALNARGADMPVGFLTSCLASRDFMVRETAAQMLAKAGHAEGLQGLFHELERGDLISTGIISFTFEELLGSALGAYPTGPRGPEQKAVEHWRDGALKWWHDNQDHLKFEEKREKGKPYWKL